MSRPRSNRSLRYLAGVLALLPAVPALAQGDSSASAGANFHDAVLASQGVLLRVPINESGQENTAAAEMRLSADAVPQGSDVPAAFASATPISSDAVLPATTDPNGDSSTCGWYGWGNYGYNGGYSWAQPNYYSYYTPSYSYYNTSYNYSYSYSYASAYSSYSPSYRYYYYPRSSYGYGGNYYNWY